MLAEHVFLYHKANLIGYFTGSSIPPAVLATTGSMTLSFKSDMGITRTGFTAFFETGCLPFLALFLSEFPLKSVPSEVCKGGCGGNGWCVPGGCDCDIGYEGTNCLQSTLSFSVSHDQSCFDCFSFFFFPSMQQLVQTIVITQLARAVVTKSGRDASVMTLGRDQIAVSVMQMPVLMVKYC